MLDAIGYWGVWQAKAFFVLGLFFMNAVLPTMVLTFLNVESSFFGLANPLKGLVENVEKSLKKT